MSLPDFGNEGGVRSEAIDLLGKYSKIDFAFVDLKPLAVDTGSVDDVEMCRDRSQRLHGIKKGRMEMITGKFRVRNVET